MTKRKSKKRRVDQNRNAFIRQFYAGSSTDVLETASRDENTMTARAFVRSRSDVDGGRSFSGLSIKTAGGRSLRFNGNEARTIYRLLSTAMDG